MKLSQENINKLCMTGLYQNGQREHCRNHTYKIIENKTGYYAVDTYFDDYKIELTDDNIYDFKFIFDFNKVRNVEKEEYFKYDEENRFVIAVDSGGWSYPKYYVNKDSNPSKEKCITIINDTIEYHKRQIEWLKQDLKKLEDDKC